MSQNQDMVIMNTVDTRLRLSWASRGVGVVNRPMGRVIALIVVASFLASPSLAQTAAGDRSTGSKMPIGGVFVLDDSDREYKGKDSYHDKLTLRDRTGKVVFSVGDINGCQTIGSNRQIAVDSRRGWVWVTDLVSRRIRKFDHRGKQLLSLDDIHAGAIAIDPQTGNLWAVLSEGRIGFGKTAVFDPRGKRIVTHDVRGWDIAYDRTSRSFWLGGRDVTKIDAETGKVILNRRIAGWCASSIDVDPTSGSLWLAIRGHGRGGGGKNELVRLDRDGKLEKKIELEVGSPLHVSVDAETGFAWVAIMRKCVQLYSPKGKLVRELKVKALTCQADPASGGVWVVTREKTMLFGPTGEQKVSKSHTETLQAWIASPEFVRAASPTVTIQLVGDGTIRCAGRAVTVKTLQEATAKALEAQSGDSVRLVAAANAEFRDLAPLVSAMCRGGARNVEIVRSRSNESERAATETGRSVFTVTKRGQVVHDGREVGFPGVSEVLERVDGARRHVIIRGGDDVSVGLIVQLLHPIWSTGVRRTSIRVPATLAGR